MITFTDNPFSATSLKWRPFPCDHSTLHFTVSEHLALSKITLLAAYVKCFLAIECKLPESGNPSVLFAILSPVPTAVSQAE